MNADLVLDGILTGIALFGACLFIVTERPWQHVTLMLLIATLWGIEFTLTHAHSARATELVHFWHPVFSLTTAAATAVILLTRKPEKKP